MKSSLIIINCVLLAGFLGMCANGKRKTRTSSDARPPDVTFLALPADVRSVAFWDDGNNRIATFVIDESGFRTLFSKYPFNEISEPVPYYRSKYGDLKTPPYKSEPDQAAAAGLFYEKIKPNGGGITLVYDRKTSTAFVNIVGW